MSTLINTNTSGLQALARVLQYSAPSSAPSSENISVQKPNWQSIQSQSSSSRTDQSSHGLNVSYSYSSSSVIKTDLSLVGGPVTEIPAPADGGGGLSTVASGYDLTMSDIDNS